MTDQSKIEAAAREQLEELAKEVACEKVGQCFTQGTDVLLIARAVKAAKYAYLAGHASRDEEVKAKDNEVVTLGLRVAAVKQGLNLTQGLLKESEAEIAALRARVAELSENAVRWVPEGGLKALMDQGWTAFYDDKRGNEPRLWLMVPPVPLPETKP